MPKSFSKNHFTLKQTKHKYRILSIVARDILSTLITIVTSKSTLMSEEGLLIPIELHYQLRQFNSCYVGLIGSDQCMSLKRSLGEFLFYFYFF
jgi:hypothetical protein